MSAQPNRLFFALVPDPEVRAACAAAAREIKLKAQPSGALVPPERYHLTLLFLGSFVTPLQEQALSEAAAALRQAPFSLLLDHASSFARERQVPWWLGPREASPAMLKLYGALRDAAHRAGITPERSRFAPHLTIVRDARHALAQTAIKPVEWRVREFVLIRSVLDSTPPEYRVIGRWPLVEAAPAEQPAQMKLF
ncbi:MAG TPA: RNA 2',3'-cyclic phosphodiesterase [Nevskiaceae bacterium]|nr:RNA 2',3'-cyclic phosphodiesterase [Nevskiaceae bacterium]